MGELRFYGASDDLVEVEGVFTEEYATERALFLVVTPDGAQARVRVAYESSGMWSVAFMPVDEDVPCPEGRVGKHDQCVYSSVLTLDVPDKTTVHKLDGVSP